MIAFRLEIIECHSNVRGFAWRNEPGAVQIGAIVAREVGGREGSR